MVQAILYR